jgi:hypothetical protein
MSEISKVFQERSAMSATAEVIERSATTQLDIRLLQPTIGAEIHGIDIGKPLDPAVRAAIHAAVIRYQGRLLPRSDAG